MTDALTFVGIIPCRIIETRAGQGFSGQAGPPALVANADRTFQITGTVPGVPIQCGIPSNARAISVNFTATAFSGAGDIRVFPAGSPLPNASILNYALENIANATSVPLGPVGGGQYGITVRADVSPTDFLADVNGYYVARPVTITLSDAAGSTTSTTPVTIASIYSADFRGQGHAIGRLAVRWQNTQQLPACAGGNATLQLVQTVACGDTTGGTVLTTMSRNCGFKAWLDYSPLFTLPTGGACLDLRVGAAASSTSAWRVVQLELVR